MIIEFSSQQLWRGSLEMLERLIVDSRTEKAMAPHSSTLAWKIPWMEEPGRLQSMGSLRVGHDWATSLSLFTFHFHALEKEMAPHSSILAWRIPGTGEPGGLPSMGSHRVGHDWSDLAAAAAADSRRERQLIIRMKTEKTKNRPRTDSSVQLIALYYLNKPWGHQCVIIQYSKCCSQKWPEFIKKKIKLSPSTLLCL